MIEARMVRTGKGDDEFTGLLIGFDDGYAIAHENRGIHDGDEMMKEIRRLGEQF